MAKKPNRGGGAYPRPNEKQGHALIEAIAQTLPGGSYDHAREAARCRKMLLAWIPAGHRKAVREAMEAGKTDLGVVRGILTAALVRVYEDMDQEFPEMPLADQLVALDRIVGKLTRLAVVEAAQAEVGHAVNVTIDVSFGDDDPGAGDLVKVGGS